MKGVLYVQDVGINLIKENADSLHSEQSGACHNYFPQLVTVNEYQTIGSIKQLYNTLLRSTLVYVTFLIYFP